MTVETRFPPWLCFTCGYKMDTASHPTLAVTPVDGDLSICVNCGALHELGGGKWGPISAATEANIPPDQRAEIAQMQRIRAEVVTTDLAKEGGTV